MISLYSSRRLVSLVPVGSVGWKMTCFKRYFVDLPHGQMHIRRGGTKDLPPLVMFHAAPSSGFSLVALAEHLAERRHVVIIDTAGTGDSEALPQSEIKLSDLAEAHWDTINALGFERVDLYGTHTGATICAELSIRHGDRINRIVMDGLSVFSNAERGNLFDNDHAPTIALDQDGTQFTKCWSIVRDAWLFWPWWDRRNETRRNLDLPPAEYLHQEVIEFLKSCTTYHRNYYAGIGYPKRERLPLVRNPVLITVSPSDQFFSHLEMGAELIPNAKTAITPERDERGRQETATLMVDFLDADKDQ